MKKILISILFLIPLLGMSQVKSDQEIKDYNTTNIFSNNEGGIVGDTVNRLIDYLIDNKLHVDSSLIDSLAGVNTAGKLNEYILYWDLNTTTWRDTVMPTGGGGGEINTMTNVGAGTGIVYYQKNGVQFEMNNIETKNNLLSIAMDNIDHDIDLTVEQANINSGITAVSTSFGDGLLKSTSGTLSAITDNSTNWTTGYDHSQITTGNPHSLDAADVGAEPAFTTLPVADGGTNSSTALNNNFVMVSTTGAVVESSTITTTELGLLNGITAALAYTGGAFHDGFSDYVTAEHVDWAGVSAGTIDPSNIASFGTTTDGLVPNPGTLNNYVLQDDGTWVAQGTPTAYDLTSGAGLQFSVGAGTGRILGGAATLALDISGLGEIFNLQSVDVFPVYDNSATTEQKISWGNMQKDIVGVSDALATGFLKVTVTTGLLSSQTSISLTGDVSNTLPVANGGTNSSTALTNDFVMVSNTGAVVESATITTTELGLLNGITAALAYTGGAFHDGFSDYVTAEHVDWAGVSAGTIDPSNIASFGTTTDGLVPNPGTLNNYVLRDDGTWVAQGAPTTYTLSLGTLLQFSAGAGTDRLLTGAATIDFNTVADNLVLAGPTTGGPLAPTFRSLVVNDIPDLSGVYEPAFTTLPVADGGTNSATALNNDFVMISNTGAVVESATITTTELGLLNGITAALAYTGGTFHDGFSDYLADEHIDWKQSQISNKVHADNIAVFTTTVDGLVNAPGTLNNYVLRDDGTWVAQGAPTTYTLSLGSTLGFTAGAGTDRLLTGVATIDFNTVADHLFLSGPLTGGPLTPTFRAIVDDDVPDDITITGYEPTLTKYDLSLGSLLQFSVGAGTGRILAGAATIDFNTVADNLVLAGPTTGGPLAPTFRSLVENDIPDLSGTYEPAFTTLPIADGGTNSNTALNNDFVMVSNTGAVVESSTITTTELGLLNGITAALAYTGGTFHDGFSDFVTAEHYDWSSDIAATATVHGNNIIDVDPNLATGFLKVTTTTGALSSQASISLTGDVANTLPVANGGTNSATALNNDFVIVSTTGAVVESATITTTELGLLNGLTNSLVDVSGTPATTYMPYFTDVNTITTEAAFYYTAASNRLTVEKVEFEANPASGVWSGLVAIHTATTSCTQYSVVTQTTTANTVKDADSDNEVDMRVIGIATATATTGNIEILEKGYISNSGWTWTVGAKLYVSATGTLTETNPSTGYSQWVADAVDSDTIKFHNKGALLTM